MQALARSPKMLSVALGAAIAVLVLAGCGGAANTGDSYVLTVTATRSSGAGDFDITIEDEVAVVGLVSVVADPTPAGVSHTGTVDFSAPTTASVTVTGVAMGVGETMTVTVNYTENSYDPPVTRTISSDTVAFSAGGSPDLTYTTVLSLPID